METGDIASTAKALGIKPETLHMTHLKNIRRKLGARSTLEAVIIAFKRGLVTVKTEQRNTPP